MRSSLAIAVLLIAAILLAWLPARKSSAAPPGMKIMAHTTTPVTVAPAIIAPVVLVAPIPRTEALSVLSRPTTKTLTSLGTERKLSSRLYKPPRGTLHYQIE